MNPFKVSKNKEPVTPSTDLWSQANVNFIVLLTTILSLITTGFLLIAPTDKIAELGWLIIEVNSWIPNIPKLETVKVLPSISSGLNFFDFALTA